jgi:hypothetical protein
MEVHAHSHTERKRWTHYLWEFLMLFLAVFCGFLAENLREHQVEKEKARQYIHSLAEDLAKDTAQCSFSDSELTAQLRGMKEMRECFKSLLQDPSSTLCLRTIIANSSGFTDFIYTDRTIQQLKNAGGLRMIQDKDVADSIIAYDAVVREMLIHQGVLETLQQNSLDEHNSMIDYLHQDSIGKKGATLEGLQLLNKDPIALNRYFNVIDQFRKGIGGQRRLMRVIKQRAAHLLEFLKEKGYH